MSYTNGSNSEILSKNQTWQPAELTLINMYGTVNKYGTVNLRLRETVIGTEGRSKFWKFYLTK